MSSYSLEELVALSLDGALPPEDQSRLEQGLANSPALRALANDLQQLRQLAQTPVPSAPALPEAVWAEVQRRYAPKRSPWMWPSFAAVAAILVLGLLMPSPTPQNPSVLPTSLTAGHRDHFRKVLAHAEQLAQAHLFSLDPNQTRRYGDQLRWLNQQQQLCEHSASQYPDAQTIQALDQVYRAKEALVLAILQT